ncbi:hypothetical protein LXL04_023088 [Taraxacum kok-saghyz]
MAEIVLSALFTVVFEKLTSETLRKVARSKGTDSQLKKLKLSLIYIKSLLNDASEKEISDEAVKEWLNGLQHLAYDIDDLLDDLATEAMKRDLIEKSGSTISKVRKLIPTCCTNFALSSRMQAKLDDISSKLLELVETKDNLGDKDTLLHKLLRDEPCDKNFSILPIVGMGGIGKTALARLLYDEMLGNDHFQVMAWVCVSDDFDILKISKTILQSVGGGNQEFSDLNRLQVALKERISKKRFLIVLDDVWSENYAEWEILARPFLVGAHGSKIIMTTRKMSLLNQLGHDQGYHLSFLSHDSGMTLFCQHALDKNNFDSHLALKPYGEGIVEKCDGLPLALIALGRLLRSKIDEEEWKDVLNSEIWQLGKTNEIVPALRLSYNDLSSYLKLLFAYCSLFPKDYMFDKEELILLWMAEGFLHQPTTRKSLERLGLECFEELLSRSFFQQAPNDKSLFVMHNLMNDLATYVAGDFFSRLDIDMKKEFRKEAFPKHRHMSFVCEDYMVYKRFEPFRVAKSLRTFLALSVGVKGNWCTFYLSNKVLNELLNNLPLLRVLSLSDLRITEVPEVVGSMKHLRYLNLSRTDITYLPENVCNLYNLQTLIVSGCSNLIKLPKSFSKLKNLQHFDIRDTPYLKKIPLGIDELKSLRTLTKIIVGVENGFPIIELKNLKNLHGKISILGLSNVKNAMEAREAKLSKKRLSELELDWGYEFNVFRSHTDDKEVLNELKPQSGTLKQLKIVSYRGIEFPNWVGDHSFLWLTKVSIDGCEECTTLPRLGQLPSLKELLICGMTMVKIVDQEFLGTGLAFPSLEILRFEGMSRWEVWSTNSGAFPRLQQLHIIYCSKLVKVKLEALPSLRVLKLIEYGHGVLTSLVDVASSLTKLEIYNISGLVDELWRGVIGYLGEVEEIGLWFCNEIRYLWESEEHASKCLVNLRKLDVHVCSNLVSLGEKEEDNSGSKLTSLRILKLFHCYGLEHCSCPGSLEDLSIESCESLTSLSFPTGGWQKLKSLLIQNCKKLLENEMSGRKKEKTMVLINSSMRILESLHISDLPYEKTINELSCFINLTTLTITNCQSMETLRDHELPYLTSLTHMKIQNCTSMDASFPRGLWPPNLHTLAIGGLKKPISEWGPQNFPSSLVDLKLVGGLSEDARSFGQLSHLLPTSLTSLEIYGFEELESVSMGLQHLTSLQHLSIFNCRNTKYLPEMLLLSLLSLEIYRCPKLKEKCMKGGSYWPFVSLIPRFQRN